NGDGHPRDGVQIMAGYIFSGGRVSRIHSFHGFNGVDSMLISHGNTEIHVQDDGIDFSLGTDGEIWFRGPNNSTIVQGSFYVIGEKDALVFTENYGGRLLHAMEMPEIRFFDEGEG